MANDRPLRWKRILLAIVNAEALSILLLILVVSAYSFTAQAGAVPAEEFAPAAGNWVGPIGGFAATLLFAWWAARGVSARQVTVGFAVGIGTALLDFTLGLVLTAGGPIPPLLFLSGVAYGIP